MAPRKAIAKGKKETKEERGGPRSGELSYKGGPHSGEVSYDNNSRSNEQRSTGGPRLGGQSYTDGPRTREQCYVSDPQTESQSTTLDPRISGPTDISPRSNEQGTIIASRSVDSGGKGQPFILRTHRKIKIVIESSDEENETRKVSCPASSSRSGGEDNLSSYPAQEAESVPLRASTKRNRVVDSSDDENDKVARRAPSKGPKHPCVENGDSPKSTSNRFGKARNANPSRSDVDAADGDFYIIEGEGEEDETAFICSDSEGEEDDAEEDPIGFAEPSMTPDEESANGCVEA
ncbi:hypothetical protein BJY01DRAFT_247851 [Aspergillus pseudoustus]|uniref:Uncharacterized protein n=1 Tax=Aspergillus pseudoustus TaxID=1810923 RepID=A0ABR4JYB1_9EURO